MQLPRIRFTIRGLMVAIAIVAGLLALARWCGVIVFVGCFPCLALVGAQWPVFHGLRRPAACGFWTLAAVMNLLYLAACLAPDIYLCMALFLGWFVIVAPMVGGFGSASAWTSAGDGNTERRIETRRGGQVPASGNRSRSEKQKSPLASLLLVRLLCLTPIRIHTWLIRLALDEAKAFGPHSGPHNS
ncbi:MAG: hypothetical protein ACP5XB_14385 [Isosphaeraceae bacterium]